MGYSLKRMLDMFHPKVVVINDDCITTRPICLAQVKVIIMQSARMSEHLEICRRILYEEKDTRPDYFLTSGEAFRKMKEWSGAAEKVVVTGLPRYDVLKRCSEYIFPPKFPKEVRYKSREEDSPLAHSISCPQRGRKCEKYQHYIRHY